jgi:mannose-6-phosphate isomerase-like protein (cupin superfamily)
MHRYRTVVLTLGVLLGLLVGAADGWAKKAVVGSLAVATGEVRVNQVTGIPGTALFEGNVIATGAKSSAVVDLRSGARVTVGERSEVAAPYGMLPAGLELREGTVDLEAGAGQVGQVSTRLSTAVVLRSTDGFPALCRIASLGSEVSVFNEKGQVEIHGAGAPIIVPAGKRVVLGAGSPQGGLQTAGKVVTVLPTGSVERQGAAAIPLHVLEPVYWQDLVRTEGNGRVKIELTGGTVLSVGARSQLRIVKHDTASDQTELELTAGSVRGQVVKLTKPGSSFQIKTQTAVIGVVGTDVIVISTPNSTTVICLDGTVTVTSAAGGSVTLQPGQSTTVPAGGAPSTPVAISSGALQAELVGFFPSPGAGLGLGVSYWSFIQLGLGAATVGVLGVTVKDLGKTESSFTQAGTSSSSASSSFSGAGNSYNNVGGQFNGLGCSLNNLGQSEGQQNSLYVPPAGFTCQ